jgi:hypothetical protein
VIIAEFNLCFQLSKFGSVEHWRFPKRFDKPNIK